ncbi:dTDP-4-dehydrorhamnose reductase [Novosphingobium hassiacum]|uniref:dTDP-4-dehydrorhamnose reductase n=1 Tax=Novosphingobium hassiacum TaxID=173676 RepID=A0A7W5ZSR7_9SPHN|nr:family 1 glycosylhydrolase [Novosphingobium hassiacum]MBB3858792.1 dTDP-4-dehydrorhamnose reductase [Novosphingobium hassiacum]
MELELWGGAECTVNRVGDRHRDQLLATGHDERLSDMDLIAGLGFDALRFPILWERVVPDDGAPRWDWSDPRLARLREAGIRPIAGLVHHGSGPARTSLLDDGFAAGLGRYARAVATRYPWIEDWTPVNEPLTTARFSALYGIWYPHARDERAFWTALLNQIDGVRLAMRAVREVNPAARLIQTDDLGRTYATAALEDQAAFDNARRWMTWDLLCGVVVPGHDLWQRLCGVGLGERLRVIADDPCPPQIIGINHYLTSDRFLDHRLQKYPMDAAGSNGLRDFADIAAVRALEPGPPGLGGAISEAWARYGIPVAVTEVHNGCTREEQARWLSEAWDTALAARAAGVEVCAVTCWALFGNRGWNTLLTGDGHYEPGVFDARGAEPRATALAGMIAELRGSAGEARVRTQTHGAGWWRRPGRLSHGATARVAGLHRSGLDDRDRAPILITGATGTLGRALAAACRARNLAVVLTDRAQLELGNASGLKAALDKFAPWAVINAAGWVRVDDAEHEREVCMAANATGAVALAAACAERGLPCVQFSSDLVFGDTASSYVESAAVEPLNVYGRSKAAMEAEVCALPGAHLIVRTAAFFSPFDQANFAFHAVRTLSRGEPFHAEPDEAVTPTYVPDLCDAVLDLLIDGETGVWHLSSNELLSWHAFAVRIAQACGLNTGLILPITREQQGLRAARPRSCGLASERGALLPSLQSAIDRFAQAMAHRYAA